MRPPPEAWTPTWDYKMMENGVLYRRWVALEWPHEPYREKGEEIVHEEWRDASDTITKS